MGCARRVIGSSTAGTAGTRAPGRRETRGCTIVVTAGPPTGSASTTHVRTQREHCP
ncbi:hypothetical protein NE235_28630 [Actinoallomurus spadix]|uniref:hypothetical protein n=1 Tax=Actinoallomurus spadix TaxID=79912 RepID=UPI002093BE13|nr:hypothetical protein [Actinoallomurus spadix]MCO5990086.1 hypothetical protein [Actinoallomurus spadix]